MTQSQGQTLDLLFYDEPVTVQDVLGYVKCQFRLAYCQIEVTDADDVLNEIEVQWVGDDGAQERRWMPLVEAAQFVADRITAQEEREYQETLRRQQEVGDVDQDG